MGMFTYIYYNTFAAGGSPASAAVAALTIKNVAEYIKSLSETDQDLMRSLIAKNP
jgi:hypothetical protein